MWKRLSKIGVCNYKMNNKPTYEQTSTRDSEKLKKQKKAIIITAICLTGFIFLYFIISAIDWSALLSNNGHGSNNSDQNIYFYDESLSYDLSTDDIYMGYDRTINLKIESTGISTTVTDKDIASHGEAVSLLYNFIEYMISGNAEAYNSCFSPTYYKNNTPKIIKNTFRTFNNLSFILTSIFLII